MVTNIRALDSEEERNVADKDETQNAGNGDFVTDKASKRRNYKLNPGKSHGATTKFTLLEGYCFEEERRVVDFENSDNEEQQRIIQYEIWDYKKRDWINVEVQKRNWIDIGILYEVNERREAKEKMKENRKNWMLYKEAYLIKWNKKKRKWKWKTERNGRWLRIKTERNRARKGI